MGTWLWNGLKWGAGIGIAGMLFLFFIGDLALIAAPLFVGVWISLGLLIGFLMARNEEQERLTQEVTIRKTPNRTRAIAPEAKEHYY
jgi:hypothetical protein